MRLINLIQIITFCILTVQFAIAKNDVNGYKGEVYEIGFDLDIDQPLDSENILLPQLHKKQVIEGRRPGGSKGLQEFTPIRNSIGQSETQYYSFSVNTSTGLGEYYEFLIFLTGNICSQSDNVDKNDTSLTVYWSFNSTMFQNLEIGSMSHFKNGYFQSLADVPSTNDDETEDSILYIAVRSPENTNTSSTWAYQIGVSQNDLVFQWDDRSWATLLDTDDASALIVTGNLTSSDNLNYTSLNASDSNYVLFIYSYDYNHYFDNVNSSWCAVRNGPALFSTSNFESSYTDRNGGLQQQFFVSGLNASTKYIAYLVADFKGTSFGGTVYQPFEFETLSSEVCQLVYDLEFCSQVAYSVPAANNSLKGELGTLYDNQAKSLYSNFSKALQQIACDTTDDAIFSPVKTCQDCANLYKNWLCSVTIPRCSTNNHTGYKYRGVGESRNDFINDEIQPVESYFEILPCVNVCQAMVRDCPADFGFMCPTTNLTISQSYYWDSGDDYVSCNFVGIADTSTSKAFKSAVLNWWMLITVVILVMAI